jgi:hypothetical protein
LFGNTALIADLLSKILKRYIGIRTFGEFYKLFKVTLNTGRENYSID